MTAERRAHARKRVSTSVMVRDARSDDPIRGWLHDISRSGCFIAAPQQVPAGVEIEFDMRIPGVFHPLSGKAKVIWVRDKSERDLPAGMGVEFMDLSADALSQIESLRGSQSN